MKKLFFTLVISLSTIIAANAQEVGQLWLGGSFGFWSSKVAGGGKTQSDYQFLPEIGYAFSDNTGIGIRLGYHSVSGYTDFEGDFINDRVNTFSVSPFVRSALLKGHFGGLFIDSGVSYAYGAIDNDDDDYSEQQIEIGIRPGVAVNVSHNVSITGKFGFIGYRHSNNSYNGYYDNKIKSYKNEFGINLDMSQFLVGAIIKF